MAHFENNFWLNKNSTYQMIGGYDIFIFLGTNMRYDHSLFANICRILEKITHCIYKDLSYLTFVEIINIKNLFKNEIGIYNWQKEPHYSQKDLSFIYYSSCIIPQWPFFNMHQDMQYSIFVVSRDFSLSIYRITELLPAWALFTGSMIFKTFK